MGQEKLYIEKELSWLAFNRTRVTGSGGQIQPVD